MTEHAAVLILQPETAAGTGAADAATALVRRLLAVIG